jgi:N-methylhydantoinase A
MLLSELKHDYVRTFVARLGTLDWDRLQAILCELRSEGDRALAEDMIPPARRRFLIRFDCRYAKQYHEVSFNVAQAAIDSRNIGLIARDFHAEHNLLFVYQLEAEQTPIELIYVRLQAIGATEDHGHAEKTYFDAGASHARKGERSVYIPESARFETVPVYDGHRLQHGNHIAGPALIETVTTAVLVSRQFDCVVDRYDSFALYRKGREDLVQSYLRKAQVELLS